MTWGPLWHRDVRKFRGDRVGGPVGLDRPAEAGQALDDERIRALVTGGNDRCHPLVWPTTSAQILQNAHRPSTSKTDH